MKVMRARGFLERKFSGVRSESLAHRSLEAEEQGCCTLLAPPSAVRRPSATSWNARAFPVEPILIKRSCYAASV
jgi:hypothetical protein